MLQQILRLGKDSLIYGVGSVVMRFIGLLLLPVFTTYLTPEDYGILAMLAILSMIAQPVFSLGLSAAMGPSYFQGGDLEAKAKTVWTALAIHTVMGVMLVFLAWLLPSQLCRLVMLDPDNAMLVSLSLTGCAITILSTSMTQRVMFEQQAGLYVAITLATAIISLSLSVLLVAFLDWGVLGMVVAQLAGNLIAFLALFSVSIRTTKPAFSRETLLELLRLGFPMVPSFAFLFIITHSNKYLIEWLIGIKAVGVYAIGFNMGMVLSILTSGIATAWYPFFMSYIERQKEVEVLFGKIFTYYVFCCGTICLLFFFFAKPVVILLTKSPFHDAHQIVGWIALSFMFQGAFNFFLPGFYYLKEIKYVTVIQGIAAVVSLAVNYPLISIIGTTGAAIGIAVSNLIMIILVQFWNTYRKSAYPNILFEWNRVVQFICIFIAFLIIRRFVAADSIAQELVVSMLLSVFSISSIYFLLDEKEKSLLKSNLLFGVGKTL